MNKKHPSAPMTSAMGNIAEWAPFLDGIPSHVAILSRDGTIVAVNDAWRSFAESNEFPDDSAGVGWNYLDALRSAGIDFHDRALVLDAMSDVLEARRDTFEYEYPCHSETEQRWFRMLVNRPAGEQAGGALVMHINITDRVLSEHQTKRLHTELTERLKELNTLKSVAELLREDRLPVNDLFGKIATLLPGAFQYPEQVVASVMYGRKKKSATDPFESEAKLRAEFETHDGLKGVLRVAYPRKPMGVDVPFLPEEQQLLNSCADLLRGYFERRLIMRESQYRQAMLEIAGKVGRIGAWKLVLPSMTLSWSDEAYDITGWPKDRPLVLNEVISTFAQEYHEQIYAVVDQCVHHGVPYDVELEVIHPDGKRVWIRAIGEPVRDESGTIVALQGALQDIQNLKQLKQSASEVQRRFREMADAMPMIVWTAAPDGAVDYGNKTFSRYTGVARDRPLEELWKKVVHPDDLPRALEEWTTSRQRQTEYKVEFRIRRHDGIYRWNLVSATPARDPQGEITKWYGTASDIHDTKQTEEDARQIADRLQNILLSITDAFFTLDEAGRVTYVNPRAETLLRRTADQLANKVLWESGAMSTDSPLAIRFRHAMANKVAAAFELFHEPVQRWLDVRAYPSADGLSIYVQDITERKSTESELRIIEERFRLLARATNDAIWDWNMRTNDLWWNEGFETLFGFTREEVESSLESWTKRIHPEDYDHVMEVLQRVVDGRTERLLIEYRFLKKDGTYAFVEDRAYPIRDEAGQAVRMIGGMSDITEDKRRDEMMLRSQRMESIGTLAGGIAHDLNNLLSPILMGAGLIKAMPDDPDCAAALDEIERCALRAAELVRQVLTFARGTSGNKVEVAVESVVNDIDAMIRHTFPRGIDYTCEVQAGLPRLIGDATQIHQVLMNLCVNARDAMPNGGELKVKVSAVQLDAQYTAVDPDIHPGRYICVEVADTGCGIPRAIRDRIFDPFFTTKEMGDGTGLGLSTSLGIVRSHGGLINVYSEVGQGTTFKVYLPVDQHATAMPLQWGGESTGGMALPRGDGETILVVDDESMITSTTRMTLEAYGYKVLTASDGADGLATFVRNKEKIALVLTDMMMPVMDGPALVAAVRRISPHIPIVATSGLESNARRAHEVKDQVRFFIKKPCSTSELVNVIAEALQS